MKKILLFKFILCIALAVQLRGHEVEASDHLAFQKLEIFGGQLLQNYTEEELDEEIKGLGGRQFWGWEADSLTVAAKAYFTSHTIFSYYNTGTSKIDYTCTTTITTTTKISYSATGQVKYSLSGTKAGFKNGLDVTLKLDYNNDNTVVEKEEVKMSFSCDPNTRVIMYMAGEGTLYN
ncbi:MAG: hypothetical protein R3Y60_03585, partial [bacterium]